MHTLISFPVEYSFNTQQKDTQGIHRNMNRIWFVEKPALHALFTCTSSRGYIIYMCVTISCAIQFYHKIYQSMVFADHINAKVFYFTRCKSFLYVTALSTKIWHNPRGPMMVSSKTGITHYDLLLCLTFYSSKTESLELYHAIILI